MGIKRISLLVSCIFIITLLSGCSGNAPDTQSGTKAGKKDTGSEAVKSEATDEKQAGDMQTTGESSNILVAYFSATGNTKRVADTIAEVTGADVFEIVPVDAYTNDDLDYNDKNSRVYQEHDDAERQVIELVSETPAGWEGYEIIFIGYPKMEYSISLCI